MSRLHKKLMLTVMLAAALTLFVVPTVLAGVTGAEFQDIYDLVKGWTSGYLGKLFSVAFFLVGIAMGMFRQSLAAVGLGVGAAIAVHYTPTIIESIATATM